MYVLLFFLDSLPFSVRMHTRVLYSAPRKSLAEVRVLPQTSPHTKYSAKAENVKARTLKELEINMVATNIIGSL